MIRMTMSLTFTMALGIGAAGAQDAKVLFAECFDGKLDKDWAWLREDPKAWRLEEGALVLRNLPGYLHRKYNNSRNILLRALPKSDKPLAVEVHVESEPKEQFEHAGVVWYLDDDNYVSLFQEMLNKKVELQMVNEKEGIPRFAVVEYAPKGVWMRLELTGDKFTTQYRAAPKDAWKTVGAGNLPMALPGRVGVMAGGAPKDGERLVRFRDFRILELTP